MMRVFVTGASGFIGSAIVRELLDAGHGVIGLARSDASAKRLVEAGAEVHRGDLVDRESLISGVAGADAVIHTAFVHDFANFKESCEIDRRAIETLGSALRGTDRPLIVTSGTALLGPGTLATEETAPPASSAIPRVSEQAAEAVAAQGVKTSVVRLPPSVHGDGDSGFIPIVIGLAREKGVSAVIGEGLNHWPGVHRLDAARLYRLVVEKGVAGARYHAIADEGVPYREIAAVVARRLNVPVVSLPPEKAAEHFGWFALFAGIDNRASSQRTREALGWTPTQPGLLADIDRPSYFESPNS